MVLTRIQTLILFLTLALLSCSDCRISSDDQMRILSSYAIQFDPCATADCNKFNNIPDSVACVVFNHPVTEEYTTYVILVLLKQYVYQYENFHQGREIRQGWLKRENPFVEGYYKISKTKGGGDFMTAAVAYDWVLKNKYLLSNKYIKEEVKKIEAVEEFINNLTTP